MPEKPGGLPGPPGLISHTNSRSDWAEAYRVIRNGIDSVRRGREMKEAPVVAPPMPGRGSDHGQQPGHQLRRRREEKTC